MHAAQTLLDRRLRALSDPTRRDILAMIRTKEALAGDIAANFAMTRPGVSRHLKVLREARLVEDRQVGTARYYKADAAALGDLHRWFECFWTEGLPKLKALAEDEAKR